MRDGRWNIWTFLQLKYSAEIIFTRLLWSAFSCFNDAAVCVYISVLDGGGGGLAGLPESKMKEEETAQPDKHVICENMLF